MIAFFSFPVFLKKEGFYNPVLLLAIFVIGLSSCANPVAPAGGPRDKRPPQIDSSRSTPNYQTNFQKQSIKLSFDEWIKLEDVFQQVVISPPLDYQPDINLRGKTVEIEFDEAETLKPNATYTINFGQAVKDITENNIAEDLRFVFSTGPNIDSLTVSGQIKDAYTGQPVEQVLFMLYENTADSVVRTQRPFYFAKTNTTGSFRVNNVRADTFKAFALLDADYNYLYNQPAEPIGFPTGLLIVSDSIQPSVQIRLFQEALPPRLIETGQPHYGLLQLKFNRRPYDFELDVSTAGDWVYQHFQLDTLNIWYNEPPSDQLEIFLQKDTVLNDTIIATVPSKSEFLKVARLRPEKQSKARRRSRSKDEATSYEPTLAALAQNPAQSLDIMLNHPLQSIDTSFIRLLEDTVRRAVAARYAIDSTQRKKLRVFYPWRADIAYELQLLPGALTDWFGIRNDSIIQPLSVMNLKKLGNINLIVEDLKPDTAYIVNLELQSGAVVKTFFINGDSTFQRVIPALPAGEYALRLIEDVNANRRWDPGHYLSRRQPEKVLLKVLEPLRANWDLEVKISAKVFHPNHRRGRE